MADWYWHVPDNGGVRKWTDTNDTAYGDGDTTHYNGWRTVDGDPLPTSAGQPQAGDTIHNLGGLMDLSGGMSWAGFVLDGNFQFNFTSGSGSLTIASDCTFTPGSGFSGQSGGSGAALDCAAAWLGDVLIDGFFDEVTLDIGWSVNGGKDWGSLTLTNHYGMTVVKAPTGQAPHFKVVDFNGDNGGQIDLSALGDVQIADHMNVPVDLSSQSGMTIFVGPSSMKLVKNGASILGVSAAVPAAAGGGMVVV